MDSGQRGRWKLVTSSVNNAVRQSPRQVVRVVGSAFLLMRARVDPAIVFITIVLGVLANGFAWACNCLHRVNDWTMRITRRPMLEPSVTPNEKDQSFDVTQGQEVCTRHGQILHFDRDTIIRHAPANLLRTWWRRVKVERELARRGIVFRGADSSRLDAAYSEMSAQEFASINGCQTWANWRIIPASMSDLVPDRPLNIVDLACGAGDSTLVLAFYAPLGSKIIGIDQSSRLLDIARSRIYAHQTSHLVDVSFVQHRLDEPIRDGFRRQLEDSSIDLVNCSGFVGHHLESKSVRVLADEIGRILRLDGTLIIDFGPRIPATEIRSILSDAGFVTVRRLKIGYLGLSGTLVARRVEVTDSPLEIQEVDEEPREYRKHVRRPVPCCRERVGVCDLDARSQVDIGEA